MCMTRENFKCMLSTCRLLGWPCDHSQCAGLLPTSKLLEKAADGNVLHVRQLQHFQNPFDDEICENGMQVWSYDQTSTQPFCALKPTSSVIFQSGHSIQNCTDCNWFCTPLQMTDSRFHSAVSVEEKDWWWFSVACGKFVNFVALVSDWFFQGCP